MKEAEYKMTEQKLTELLRHAYHWGRDNGSNRSEKNFNDFLQTEAAQQALSITNVVGQSEQLGSFQCPINEGCKQICKECANFNDI